MKKSITILGLFGLFSVYAIAQAPSFQWRRTLGGISYDVAGSVEQTTDRGYIVSGSSSTNNNGDVGPNQGNEDYWIVKLDSNTNIQWKKAFGGSGTEYATAARQTTDGGYIVAGYTESNNGDVVGNHSNYAFDIWILKLNSTGSVVWKKTYGGTEYDEVRDIRPTQDGGYILAGNTYSNNGDVTGNQGNEDIWVIKLNATGSIVWQKTLGGSADDWASSIRQTSDGGYVVAGMSWSSTINGQISGNHGGEDVLIAKLDANGNYLWHKCYGGTNNEHANALQQTTDGGYIVGAVTYSNNGNINNQHGNEDAWVLKLNSAGNLVWQKCFGGSQYDEAHGIAQTSDGGYAIGGHSTSVDGDLIPGHGGQDFWLFKLNSLGAFEWQKVMGGPSTDEARDLCLTQDGGFALVGPTWLGGGDVIGHHGDIDSWFVKLQGPNTCSNSYEPNDNLSTAKIIPVNTLISSQIVSSVDKDYLKFNIPAVSHVSVSLTNLPADYALKVYNASGTELGFSQNIGNTSETIWLSNLPAGDYIAYVYGSFGNYSSSSCYNLKVSRVPTSACFNTNEPNESFAAAKTIAMNTNNYGQISSSSDKDYLKFTTTDYNNISVTLTNLPANYDLKLYGPSGSQIGSSTNTGLSSETIALTNLAPGNYVAYVYGYAGANNLNSCYTLKAIATPASCANTNEPNESLSAAKNIGLNIDIKGQIATSSDKDYLKFTLLTPSDVVVNLTSLPANYNLKLYNSAGTQLGVSQNIGTTSEIISLTGLPAGTYTVYIYSYSGAYSNSSCYNLKVVGNDGTSTGTGSGSKMAENTDENQESELTITSNFIGELSVFPNPAQNRMTVLYGHHQSESARLNIIDPVMGRVVKTMDLNLLEGENVTELEVSGLARGLYFILLEGQDWRKTQRLILD